jgi:Uma2 family endonuclease
MEAEKSALSYYGLKIVAQNVSEEDYFANYEGHYEWVNGDVIDMLSVADSEIGLEGDVVEMAPLTDTNYNLQDYLADMFKAYFILRPIGVIREDPFTMRLPNISSRQPDIQVILGENQKNLKKTMMEGAANIAIEIVSDGTAAIDRGVKFEEYRKGGVQEYWIIDPEAKDALFYRLNDEGKYIAQKLENENYRTSQLPDLVLHVPSLWEEKLPNMLQVLEAVKKMLGQ